MSVDYQPLPEPNLEQTGMIGAIILDLYGVWTCKILFFFGSNEPSNKSVPLKVFILHSSAKSIVVYVFILAFVVTLELTNFLKI